MDRNDVTEVLGKPISQELLDFEATIPKAVQDLVTAYGDPR